ncbi:MAG: glycosyltransferase family 2 protein [Candidatus Hydrogenedentes bacterium]|nr:glycosyltransferase family 2 protein [Candidatus Hydrogenedentota bacterium]
MNTESSPESMRRQLAAIVPCYNAGDRVAPVVRGLLEHVDRVIVVDDGSTDNATVSLSDLGARVIRFDTNQGKGFAMLAGFRAAMDDPDVQAAAIVDADGQHDPDELPHLYETLFREGADLVIGSRAFDERQVPWRSRFGNKLTAAITRILLRQSIVDTQSGYRLHSRRLLEFLLEAVPGGRYETEMEILVKSVRNGFRVVPAPIQTIYEKGNPSSHFNKLRDSMRIYRKLLSVSLRK